MAFVKKSTNTSDLQIITKITYHCPTCAYEKVVISDNADTDEQTCPSCKKDMEIYACLSGPEDINPVN